MTLGRCPVCIFCYRGTLPRLSTSEHAITCPGILDLLKIRVSMLCQAKKWGLKYHEPGQVSSFSAVKVPCNPCVKRKRWFFMNNLLVRIHVIIVIIWWTGLAPWEFKFPFPGSLTHTLLHTSLNGHACPNPQFPKTLNFRPTP